MNLVAERVSAWEIAVSEGAIVAVIVLAGEGILGWALAQVNMGSVIRRDTDMDWKLWFARDSALWAVLFYVGLIATGLASVADPATYGIPAAWMPYIRLVAFISALVGGKMGLSYADSKRELRND